MTGVCVCDGDRSAQRRYHRRLRLRLRAGEALKQSSRLRPEAEGGSSDEIQISSGLPQSDPFFS